MLVAEAEFKLDEWNLHKEQMRYAQTTVQYATVPAARRTGKTEMSIEKCVSRAINNPGKNYFLGGPTWKHARQLFWDRLKRLLIDSGMGWLDKSEVELCITLWNGTKIWVVGFKNPERFDGKKWDGGVVDEFADMESEVWTEHIRPALMDAWKRGSAPWCYFIGVPAGRNHYWEMHIEALDPEKDNWDNFGWTTEEVLPLYLGKEQAEEELRQARRDLDTRTYNQEIKGMFVSMGGLAYYSYSSDEHAIFKQEYDPTITLDLCFDFNVSPGVCVGVQERGGSTRVPRNSEIYIKDNSNTIRICDKIIEKWGEVHTGDVCCYGDAAGRARGTAKVKGSDWDIVKNKLKPVFGKRLKFRVPKDNPPVVARINAMNCRLKNTEGDTHYYIDPSNKYTTRDFEGTEAKDDGGIKKGEKWKYLTHITDALSYREAFEHPFAERYKLVSYTV